jgi:hypothetical protein
MISYSEILKLWRNPNFPGSFRGIKTFQVVLKTDLNLDISERRLYKILKSDSIYLIHKKATRNFKRRHYDVRFYGELVQMDIAYMFNYEGFQYFLLVIDCYSSKIFVEPLKTRDSASVSQALEKIIQHFGSPISVIQSDQGKEFLGKTVQLLKSKKIVYRPKFGKNKANFAENGIYLIKRKLYMLLRGQLSHDWPKSIKLVVDSYNNTPIKKLGWLTPDSINNKIDSLKVRDAQRKYGIQVYHEPNFREQLQNLKIKKYEPNTFQVGDFVYLTFNEKLFDKSYDVQVPLGFFLMPPKLSELLPYMANLVVSFRGYSGWLAGVIEHVIQKDEHVT